MSLHDRLTMAPRFLARVPVTLTISLLAIAIACIPGLPETLELSRHQIAVGAVWRFATGHLTHWNLEHLQWDLLMFAVLGAICEWRDPRRMRMCVLTAAAGVSALVLLAFPGITTYRGLSGIDTALFTLLAFSLIKDARRDGNAPLAAINGALLVAFTAKTVYEAFTGQAIFVNQSEAGFTLLVWDHLLAGIIGGLIAIWQPPIKPQPQPQKRLIAIEPEKLGTSNTLMQLSAMWFGFAKTRNRHISASSAPLREPIYVIAKDFGTHPLDTPTQIVYKCTCMKMTARRDAVRRRLSGTSPSMVPVVKGIASSSLSLGNMAVTTGLSVTGSSSGG